MPVTARDLDWFAARLSIAVHDTNREFRRADRRREEREELMNLRMMELMRHRLDAGQGEQSAPVEQATPLPPKPTPIVQRARMNAPTTGFGASLKALMDKARAGLEQSRIDGKTKVEEAVNKLTEAQTATMHVSTKIATTIEDEAAAVMAELGQISNEFGL